MNPNIAIKDKKITQEYTLSNEQIQIGKDRKQKHLNSKSKSYKWNEIKNELIRSNL